MSLRKVGALTLVVLSACGSGDAPTRPNPSGGGSPVITAVGPLSPGQPAVLRGSNLRGIASLTLDGQPAVVVSASDAEVQFNVPALRACETDGRAVNIIVNGSMQTTGRIAAADLVNIQPGESRIISTSELSCLRFPGQAGAYVLSAHNFSRDRIVEPFFRLRTYTTAADTSATPLPSMNLLAAPGPGARELFFPALEFTGGEAGLASQDVSAFDPRYATAAEGDTLTFVDWSRIEAVTARSRELVPTYRAVVLAVAGQQVVVMDLRALDAAALVQDAGVRDRLRQAAQIVDRYALPSVRAVIDPEAAYPAGAGGRVFIMVGDLPAGGAGGITTADLLDTRYSPWVSGIGLVNLSTAFAHEPGVRPEQVATTVIHETAHLVDVLAGQRRGVASAQGWFSEALAVATEERAARMAIGQEHEVTLAQAQAPGVPAFGLRVPDALSHVYSPWGPLSSGAGASSAGAYVRGVRLVLYAMEKLGETGFAPAERSLYQRLLAHSPARSSASADELAAAWGIAAIAREAGLSPEALMEEATMAELVDDLVAAEAVTQSSLPQFRTWNNALSSGGLAQRAGASHWLPLDAARVTDVAVPAGAHHFWFLATEPGKGLSLSATQIRMAAHHRVRVTRLW